MNAENTSTRDKNLRLDDLALETLTLMQQIIGCKLQLQDLMKAGTINLAKSRYIMGNRCVSSTQLPSEDSEPFSALCRIHHQSCDVSGVISTVFSLTREEPGKKKTQSGKLNEDSDDSTSKSCSPDDTKDSLEKDSLSSTNDFKLSCDPVQWFGVLVPQNLRSAQDSFKRGVDLTVQIATLQAKLEVLRVEYCTLKLECLDL